MIMSIIIICQLSIALSMEINLHFVMHALDKHELTYTLE